MPNKSYAYLLNVEPSNLVFRKTYNNMVVRDGTLFYRTRKYVKGYEFLSFTRNLLCNKYKK